MTYYVPFNNAVPPLIERCHIQGMPVMRFALGSAVSFAVLLWMLPPGEGLRCRDGWPSQSIGLAGACSYHGGVQRRVDWRLLPISIIALLAGAGTASLAKKAKPVRPVPDDARMADGEQDPRCPACGSAMKLRIAKRGKNAGEYFLGCERYPQCYGANDATNRVIAKDLRRQIAQAGLPVPLDATDDEVIETTRLYAADLPDLKLPERWREESAARRANSIEMPPAAPFPEG
ncbi:MAG TPA: hypothetical protein QF469_08050 [Sphingomonas sanguinis]|uniref:hypothetical protein n=1 Tax=Sphingomonas sanguinis TaxID=33051 RepID=UPI002ABFFA6A|nr:hypothetical protein [Sphingomonas sanguinis]